MKTSTRLRTLADEFSELAKYIERLERIVGSVNINYPLSTINPTVPVDTPIERIIKDTSTRYVLRREGINTVGDIMNAGEGGLMKLRGFGKKKLNAVLDALETVGLFLRPWTADIAANTPHTDPTQ